MCFKESENGLKKILLVGCVSILSCLLLPSACSATGWYRISEEELTQLDYNLMRLAKLNEQSQKDLQTASNKLEASEQKLVKVEKSLAVLQDNSQKQEKSFQTAKEYWQKLEAEEKRKTKIARRQRDFWGYLAGTLFVGLVVKTVADS